MVSSRSNTTLLHEEENKENEPGSPSRHDRDSGLTLFSQERARREEADVTIVVGGREFVHYSQVLCLVSDYFDVALNSGMKEAETMRIEFPDDDPREWELFSSFLQPFSQARLTASNVATLIPWFHKFGITSMLDISDRLYAETVSPPLQRRCWKHDGHLSMPDVNSQRKRLRDLLNAYAFSNMYDLTVTKERTTRALRRQITCSPDLFDTECISSLVTIIQQEDNRTPLWSSIKDYIPVDLQFEDTQSLVSNKLFPYLLGIWMQNSEQSREGMFHA